MSMFATPRGGQSTSTGHLIEFKAGRSNLSPGSAPNKRKITADKTKGSVFIKQSNDQLMHFCWKNRETGAVVDDLIIFPGDTEFKEVKGCPDGRVFSLKFKSSEDVKLFWTQEPECDKELVQKVNDALNKTPTQRATARGGSSERTAASAAGLASIGGSDRLRKLATLTGFDHRSLEDLNALSGMDQQQLMQLLQYMNPEGASNVSQLLAPSDRASANQEPSTAASTGGNAAASPADMSQLQSLLQSIRPGRSNGPSVELSDIITGEKVLETATANASRLTPHLPTSDNAQKELSETVRSPQFRQAADVFGHALQTGQMGPVLEQFGIPSEARTAAASGNLLEFAKKLTESEQQASLPADSFQTPARPAEAPEPTAPGAPERSPVREPDAKRGKTDDDNMDLD